LLSFVNNQRSWADARKLSVTLKLRPCHLSTTVLRRPLSLLPSSTVRDDSDTGAGRLSSCIAESVQMCQEVSRLLPGRAFSQQLAEFAYDGTLNWAGSPVAPTPFVLWRAVFLLWLTAIQHREGADDLLAF
jgi:hypothetical protein